ncbi:suppressor APC domain-containing protein 2 [Pangasianodon hypophthalmus]|uniref:suppressor APC domain-containing protein 2 n=1 Tax=Pangasianodon hypophthalmus TaxID=310915 RepID=UPI000EFFE8C3|nr:suppressor APC domain-containing protein 2 [Pangasianodon hypophthalmus]
MALIAPDPSCTQTGLKSSSGRKECAENTATALKNTSMQPQDAEFNTDGLPKAFLHSLRTLFDILDDGKRGYVHISEIESRWQGADTQDLPGGVLESLRRVTPPHGCLTFQRFVAGLRYSILNPDKAHPSAHTKQHFHPNGFRVRPLGPSNGTNVHHSRASALQNRTRQQYDGRSCVYTSSSKHCASDSSANPNPSAQPYARSGRSLERVHVAPERAPNRADSVRVGKKVQQPTRVQSVESIPAESFHKTSQQQGERVGLPRSQSETTTGFTATRRHSRSREEPRRHTITNGVDYGMLKQMKELEQEKDSLLSGLDVVERAREWYQNQIHNVNERQRLIGQSGHLTDFLTESNQCRLNVLLPKLQEVNRCLNELISCSGMSFPSPSAQSSVLSPSVPPVPAPPQAIQRLKDQNHLLTQEVTEKSERITQLEQEKSALIKQLFEARARSAHDNSVLDSTFI